MIVRDLESLIHKRMWQNKTIVIHGARQVGKTTLVEKIIENESDVLCLSGDEKSTHTFFENISLQMLKDELSGYRYLVIDEAQRIEDIGIKLKMIHDNFKSTLQIIATGSSSFDLANKINEPLTGRKWEYNMFPLRFGEMVKHTSKAEEILNLEQRLLYGYYPDVVNNPDDAREYLSSITSGNLYKDILKWGNLNKSDKLVALLQALSYQIGSQVSFNELGSLIGLDPKTVEKYITLLEQSYIIFRCGSFSRNLRNELKSSYKFYFFDTGVRNSIIKDFTPINIRQDIGHLFENFVIAEFVKRHNALDFGAPAHFWRNKTGQEIDLVDAMGGEVKAYEIKWSPNANVRFPKAFMVAYSPQTNVVTRENYADYLLDK